MVASDYQKHRLYYEDRTATFSDVHECPTGTHTFPNLSWFAMDERGLVMPVAG